MKNRNRIGDKGDPWGMPVWVWIHSLSYPVNAIRVRLLVRKLAMTWINHSGSPFLFRIQRRRSWETLSKAPAKSKLSIDTTHPGRAFHAVWTHEVSKPTADRVDRCFQAPIWFQGSNECSSAALLIRSAKIFSITFARVFSSAIGR